MAEAFDPRIVRLSIETEDGLKTYEGLNIRAVGTKYANDICTECTIQIHNLDKETRDFILNETTPFQKGANRRDAKRVHLDVGRQSYGTFRLFSGEVLAGHITQPPDIGLVLKSINGFVSQTSVVTVSTPANQMLSALCRVVSDNLGTTLDFQATDALIGNVSFTGSAKAQITLLNKVGNINAFRDGDILFVKDRDKPLKNQKRTLTAQTGMIGVPQVTEQGVYVKMLIDNTIQLGGELKIESEINPAANGTFTIYKLTFDVANRDTPFYYVAECKWTINNVGT